MDALADIFIPCEGSKGHHATWWDSKGQSLWRTFLGYNFHSISNGSSGAMAMI